MAAANSSYEPSERNDNTSITDYLLSRLNIHVSGACGPKRQNPLETFQPIHQPYQRSATPASRPIPASLGADPTGALRAVSSSAATDGLAYVLDKDMEKAFESAVGQETMLVAIEAFVDANEDLQHDDEQALLRRFGDYVHELGSQPVTVTISSLVHDLLDSYANVTQGLASFSWKQNLETLVEEFIRTRECFFHSTNRAPVMHVTFAVLSYRNCELDVDLHYARNPPVTSFHDLRNVITEGEEFVLRPVTEKHRNRSALLVTTEYFLGPEADWLYFDEYSDCFRGVVPRKMASQVGAERFETYTILLGLTAQVIRHFPGQMMYEKVIRCDLPLTVKRQPSRCMGVGVKLSGPSIARPTASRITAKQQRMLQPAKHRHNTSASVGSPRGSKLGGAESTILSDIRQIPKSTLRGSSSQNQVASPDRKENETLTTEDVFSLLKLKADSARPPSPVKMNSLSLAQYYEAFALSQPQPSSHLRDVEVHTVPHIEHDKQHVPDKDRMRKLPRTPDCTSARRSRRHHGSKCLTLNDTSGTREQLDLGFTHVNRHGRLASHSDSEEEDGSRASSVCSPPLKDISPPAHSLLPSTSPRKKGKSPLHCVESPSRPPKPLPPLPTQSMRHGPKVPGAFDSVLSLAPHEQSATCETCKPHDPKENSLAKTGIEICPSCTKSSVYHGIDNVFSREPQRQLSPQPSHQPFQPEPPAMSGVNTPPLTREPSINRGRRTTQEWQAVIQENYREFEEKSRSPEKCKGVGELKGMEEEGRGMKVTVEDSVDSDEEMDLSGYGFME